MRGRSAPQEVAALAEREQAATPMLRQYRALKARYPDALLWFRLGDFYEMFERDAELAASVLNITLTRREVGRGRYLPMCGVPYHAAEGYLAQLVEAGYRVAICEQLEDPRQAKGVVRRDVVRVVTPGTLMEGRSAHARDRRYLAALWPGERQIGLAFADLGTGEFRTTSLPVAGAGGSQPSDDPARLSALEPALRELERLEPTECLLPARLTAECPALVEAIRRRCGAVVTPWQDAAWEASRARALLTQHFRVASLDAFGIEGRPEQLSACGAALHYLKETQQGSLAHVTGLQSYRADSGLVIDPTSRLNLELTASLRHRTREGSLLGVLDETRTGPGSRLLRRFVEEPLTDVAAIARRLDAVEVLVHESLLRARLREALKGCPDPERLLARLGCGRAGPRDLAGLRAFLERLVQLQALLAGGADEPDSTGQPEPACGRDPAGQLNPLLSFVGPLQPPPGLLEELKAALVDDPPAQAREGGFIRPGYDQELDRLREAASSGRAWIADLEARERERTGIKSLKVGYNRVFGYYIEVTRPNLSKVPPDYERRQTLTGAERFVTAELKEWEARVLDAEERTAAREQLLFDNLVARTLAHAASLRALAEGLARLDVASTLAEVAARRGWVRPVVDDGWELHIEAGRHPVVEALAADGGFVPNDLTLTPERFLAVVTGPNMGGKSTFLRQVALIVLLAQMGSFVPAASARIGWVDRILTRVGASDDLASGRSTFLVEMAETAYILRHATPRSLVILDEVGRGTATYDGLSLAWAIVEHLHRAGVRCLVATHFHELTRLADALPGAFNLHVAVQRRDGELLFLRQVRSGPADRSYGIEVARLAGLPEDVVRRAAQILEQLELKGNHRPDGGGFAVENPDAPTPAPRTHAMRNAASRSAPAGLRSARGRAGDPDASQKLPTRYLQALLFNPVDPR